MLLILKWNLKLLGTISASERKQIVVKRNSKIFVKIIIILGQFILLNKVYGRAIKHHTAKLVALLLFNNTGILESVLCDFITTWCS